MSGSTSEAEEERARMRANWEAASPGWARQADRLRGEGMPVTMRMLEQAALQPGQKVLELAAGPGDVGFLAAEQISPRGLLISSDGAEGMLAVARERAEELGVDNVEFRQLELEWIDMSTAEVDVILCRWGVMLCVDPAAAVGECRRVLKPGGRLVLAVWDAPELNPAMRLPGSAAVALGLAEEPPPGGPGPFALAAPGALEELLRDAGFLDPVVEPVAIEREYESAQEWIGETVDLSRMFNQVWSGLDGERRRAVLGKVAELAREYTAPDGSLRLPGQSLVAVAEA